MRTVKNSKLPLASDIRSALTPVCVLVSVTFASGTTPPEAVADGADDGRGFELRERGRREAKHKQNKGCGDLFGHGIHLCKG